MKSNHRTVSKETVTADEPIEDSNVLNSAEKPQGIGMAVAFDWGLAVQILATPYVMLLMGQESPLAQFKIGQPWNILLNSLITLPFAALVAIFGDGIRRGWRWARLVQIVFNGGAFLAGFYTLFGLWQGSKHGNYWSAVTVVILLVFSPLIVWRLTRPSTRRWFATVSRADALKRHGGAWPWLIAIWAIIGGILQTFAAAH